MGNDTRFAVASVALQNSIRFTALGSNQQAIHSLTDLRLICLSAFLQPIPKALDHKPDHRY
jgi:hypothetical protein